jgi:nitrilase
VPAVESQPFIVAAVQAAPVFLDLDATIDKACGLIAEAGRGGAKLVVFPEAFVPGYPDWVWSVPASRRPLLNELYGELVANSIAIPGPAIDRLCDAACAAGSQVVIGVNERNVEASGSSLYNTLVFIDGDGRLMGKHRKLIPTGGERLMWAQGDGSTLQVYDTPLGRLGGLICWENYMPLARYAMYAWGVQILIAATWDRGEPWLSTMRHIGKEGRTFVIGCCQALRVADIPDRFAFKADYPAGREWVNAGDSVIIDPDGQILAGPLHEREEILYATIDPRRMTGPRWMLDVAGHYARPDVFQFAVRRVPRSVIGPVTDEADGADGAPAGNGVTGRRPRAPQLRAAASRSRKTSRRPARTKPRRVARAGSRRRK